jgi:phage tail sheath gpL-like
MAISPNQQSAINGAGVENVQFKPTAEVLEQKNLIIATYDPLKTAIVDNVETQVLNADEVGANSGFGFMAHRLAVRSFQGSQGIPTFIIYQSEVGTAAAGTITFTASSATAGTIPLYVAGLRVPVSVATGDDGDAIAIKVVAALDALADSFGLPTTQAVDGVTLNEVDFTAKSKGPWGNGISLTFNWGEGEELPAGVTAVVVDMAGGATVPDIDDALNATGTGDGQNEAFYTNVTHGYGQDSGTLDKISTYNGTGNTFVGNYRKEVGRPFKSLVGDTVAGSGGLTALVAVGDGRKLDRTNGIIPAPGSPNHPDEIAAWAMGDMSLKMNERAESSPIGRVMPFIPGEKADRWTSEAANREIAIDGGISATQVESGVLVMKNIVSFYHPDNVPDSSNGYKSMRNLNLLANEINAVKLNFSQGKWIDITLVEDKAKVTNIASNQRARDLDDAIDDLVALIESFEENAWVYNSAFTINELKKGDKVAFRAGLTGFDMIFPLIQSGEGGITNTTIQFDTSIAITQ